VSIGVGYLQFASCLINAQLLLAHSPAADDNLIGCRSHGLTVTQYPFLWQPLPISVLIWVRSFV